MERGEGGYKPELKLADKPEENKESKPKEPDKPEYEKGDIVSALDETKVLEGSKPQMVEWTVMNYEPHGNTLKLARKLPDGEIRQRAVSIERIRDEQGSEANEQTDEQAAA